MRIDALLPRQSSDCIPCPDPPPCVCANPNDDCFRTNRDCNTCSTFRCVPKGSTATSSRSAGVSGGAVAGAVVGSLIFLAFAVALYLWYRRRNRIRSLNAKRVGVKDVPASAETVLNRPDPTEKLSRPPTQQSNVRVYSTNSSTTIDLDPESNNSPPANDHSPQSTRRSNPFDDTHSLQTAITEGTNVIPIALVTPDGSLSRSPSQSSQGPVRPPRSPDLNLNLEHVNVSHENVRPMNYAQSQISEVSGMSRNSFMSGASYSSDFLNEAPMIITPNKGAVRQVLGVVKAEVINASALTASSADGLKLPGTRPTVTSPLATTSFGPGDLSVANDDVQSENPFSDRHISTRTTLASSPAASTTTFGPRSPTASRPMSARTESEFGEDGPLLPWIRGGDDSRPSSMSTQAGSVIGFGNATRVNVGLKSPGNRTTMGRLITPSTGEMGTFEEQQQRAMEHAARTQGDGLVRRISGTSVLSTSTRADSILESFPFVPPSPISNRPVRSPPVSPLAQQSFSNAGTAATQRPPIPHIQRTLVEADESDSELPAPPDRRTLGLSTGSQLSTASSGLGSFPFQIEGRNSTLEDSLAPTAFNGRQRASLDTLAITSDLTSYPLGFDRDSGLPPPFQKN